MKDFKKYRNIIVTILFVTVFCIGARTILHDSPEVTKNVENISKIENGMSLEDVIKIMGEPQFRKSLNYEETLIYTSQTGMSGDYEIGISTKDKKVYRIYHGE